MPCRGARRPLLALGLAALLAAAEFASPALPRTWAQTPAAPATITGTVHLATPGASLSASVAVQLIVLEGSATPTSLSEMTDPAGNFRFHVDADPAISYVPFLIFEGVRYFSEPGTVRFEAGGGEAHASFEVYSATSGGAGLEIEQTTLVATALERSTETITLVREDLIVREDPTVFIGGDDGVTLRIPVPDGTLEAGGGDAGDDAFSFDGSTVNVRIPLRPGRTSIVTRFRVGYDRVLDFYRLRLTAPLPTAQIELRVAERFVDRLEPESAAARLVTETGWEGEPVLVVRRVGTAAAGQGLVVNLVGLSGATPAHPLTRTTGAAAGSVAALLIIAGGALWLSRGGPRQARDAGPNRTGPDGAGSGDGALVVRERQPGGTA